MTETKVDPNEAPDGYVAVEYLDVCCSNCVFDSDIVACNNAPCLGKYRKDKTAVYFIKAKAKENNYGL